MADSVDTRSNDASETAAGMAMGTPVPEAELPNNAIEVRGLLKQYRGSTASTPEPVTALKAIDLAIPRGSLFGLLGPNGAGKSTFINILAGLVNKSAGMALVWGYDIDRQPRHARASIGVVPQELSIDPFFTPYELLELHGGLYGVPKRERRTAEILEAVGLTKQANAYARTLSGGMRRRLMVAKAMVHAPPILVLDEPTAGVDVELRRHLWEHVRALNQAGTTILLTTHYLEEAEELCDTIAIIDKGAVVACEPTQHLLRRLDHKELVLTLDRDCERLPDGLPDGCAELVGRSAIRLRYRRNHQRVDGVLDAVRAAGYGILDISSHEADLEDIFLQLTGSRGGGGAATP